MKKPRLEENITKSLTSVRWDFTVSRAKALMDERNIRHLPVRNQEGELVGILSDRDLNRAMDPEDASFDDEAIVGDFMSRPVITVETHEPLEKVVKIMIEGKISSLLVTKKQDVIGIVTSEDLLKLLWAMLKDQSRDNLTLDALKYEPLWREVVREANAVGI